MATKYFTFFRTKESLKFITNHNAENFRVEFLKRIKRKFYSFRVDEVTKSKSTIQFKNHPMRFPVLGFNLLNGIRKCELIISINENEISVNYDYEFSQSLTILILGLIFTVFLLPFHEKLYLAMVLLAVIPIEKIIVWYKFRRMIKQCLHNTENDIIEEKYGI